jgi:hypothetical protein
VLFTLSSRLPSTVLGLLLLQISLAQDTSIVLLRRFFTVTWCRSLRLRPSSWTTRQESTKQNGRKPTCGESWLLFSLGSIPSSAPPLSHLRSQFFNTHLSYPSHRRPFCDTSFEPSSIKSLLSPLISSYFNGCALFCVVFNTFRRINNNKKEKAFSFFYGNWKLQTTRVNQHGTQLVKTACSPPLSKHFVLIKSTLILHTVRIPSV